MEIVHKVRETYVKIAKLDSLRPSPNVDILFTRLVTLCTNPKGANLCMESLSPLDNAMRRHLIRLCAEAESLMELHFSQLLGASSPPSISLHADFPYYDNYVKLAKMECDALAAAIDDVAAGTTRVAFIGSGPLPLSSMVMVAEHFPAAVFHNYDRDAAANAAAKRAVAAAVADAAVAKRMEFHTMAAEELRPTDLGGCQVVWVAALVGVEREEKARVLRHVRSCMDSGAVVVVRSARGARAFLYPVVQAELCRGVGFEVLSVVHPTDDVINSVIIARKV